MGYGKPGTGRAYALRKAWYRQSICATGGVVLTARVLVLGGTTSPRYGASRSRALRQVPKRLAGVACATRCLGL
eukprot:3292841-Rhodomonas_salina.2